MGRPVVHSDEFAEPVACGTIGQCGGHAGSDRAHATRRMPQHGGDGLGAGGDP